MSSSNTAHENRLAQATSPYLLQHKHNPVDWWPWGPEALAEAKRSNQPILLSVGYAACHWCHVMAHESFEDEATARVMNELFVNIKVDREERPDIDQIYMTALHLLGEQGGWPLTMFLTPQGEPVWGGTYFPKESPLRPAGLRRRVARGGAAVSRGAERDRAEPRALLARLADKARPAGKVTIGLTELDAAAHAGRQHDRPVNGGMRGAPKFPQPAMLEMLWRAGLRTERYALFRDGRAFARTHVRGRHLRSSRRRLLALFGRRPLAGAAFREDALRQRATARTAGARLAAHRQAAVRAARARDGRLARARDDHGEGAFCASLDADSEGEEGKFYVWSQNEIVELLGPDAGEFFAQHYDVTAEGNFEGHNILNRLKTYRAAKPMRHGSRSCARCCWRRAPDGCGPGLDDKVLADWNGLMIAALVNAGITLDEPDWLAMAKRAFDFIARTMTPRRPARPFLARRASCCFPASHRISPP